MALVHYGRGKSVYYPEPKPAPLKEGRRVAKARLCKSEIRSAPILLPQSHTGYQPGSIIDLGHDQCRFSIAERHVFCGAKVWRGGASWCAAHHLIVYGRAETRDVYRDDQRGLSK